MFVTIQKVEKLAPATRKCPGCVSYELLQNNEDENIFIFHEVWESEKFFKEHFQIPECKEFSNSLEGIAQGEVKPWECHVIL